MRAAFLLGVIFEAAMGAVKPAMIFCQFADLPFTASQPCVAPRAAPRAALFEA